MAATRWLARVEAMNVIIDQWDALRLHFVSGERCHTAKLLCEDDDDPQNKLYMLYVRKVLKEAFPSCEC